MAGPPAQPVILGVIVLLAAMIVSAGFGVAVGILAEHTLARAQARREPLPLPS